MREKPPKRQYRSRGCARCGGYGVVFVYEQNFASHNGMIDSFGRWKAGGSAETGAFHNHVGFLIARAVPLLCPNCRNAQEAAVR